MFNHSTSGYTLADIAAVTGNESKRGGTFGDDWAWIIILLLAFGGNGFGFGGNGRSEFPWRNAWRWRMGIKHFH